VLAILVATAVGGCAGRSASGRAAPAPTAPSTASPTQVLTFQAFDDRGLLPGLVRAVSTSGACTGGSLTLGGRADAWRCTAGGTVLDPCFSAEGSTELACVPDPFTHDVTILLTAGPLPRGNRNDPGHPAWFLELADGSRCGATAGTGTAVPDVSGRRLAFACSGGLGVFGDPDTSASRWRVQVGSESDASALRTVEVDTAWY
jgi:hypothetical protein